jgi:Predicted transcriptional regulator
MRDVVYLDQIEQAEALLKPQRIEVLRQLAEPRSCTEVAVELDQTPQRVYYHVKRLLEAGLVRQVAERRVRGIHEGIYQAAGRSYWLSPGLVGRIGLRQTRDRLSLGYLVDLMEDVQADVAALDLTRPDLPRSACPGTSGCARSSARRSSTSCSRRCRTCSPATAVPRATRSAWPSPAIRREIPMTDPDLRLRAVVPAPRRSCTRR